jgi:peptidoglycan/LPS O-acetylase OafA/YrhL
MKFNLLSLVLLATGTSVLFAVVRLTGSSDAGFPICMGTAAMMLGLACLAQMTSRPRPTHAWIRIVEWLVFFTILLLFYFFWQSSPDYQNYRR